MKIEIDWPSLGIYIYTETSFRQIRVFGIIAAMSIVLTSLMLGFDSTVALAGIGIIEALMYVKKRAKGSDSKRSN